VLSVVSARYNPEDWNIYVAQASDGDNLARDNEKTIAMLRERILPLCQYYAYIEVGSDTAALAAIPGMGPSDLWAAYEDVAAACPHFAMRKVHHRREIYPVLHELFRKRGLAEGAGA